MTKKIVLPIAAVTALLLMVAWMAGLFADKVQPGLQQVEAARLDDAITVERRAVPIIESVPASVEAKHATLVSSRILAGITAIHVRAGDSIEKGQLIIELEKEDLLSKAEQANEQIHATEARLTEARKNLERARELNQQRLIARSSLDAAQADHDALVAKLSAAQQALEEARTTVAFSQIRAPIAGLNRPPVSSSSSCERRTIATMSLSAVADMPWVKALLISVNRPGSQACQSRCMPWNMLCNSENAWLASFSEAPQSFISMMVPNTNNSALCSSFF